MKTSDRSINQRFVKPNYDITGQYLPDWAGASVRKRSGVDLPVEIEGRCV